MMEHDLAGAQHPEHGPEDSVRDTFEPQHDSSHAEAGADKSADLGFGAGVDQEASPGSGRKKSPRRRKAAGSSSAGKSRRSGSKRASADEGGDGEAGDGGGDSDDGAKSSKKKTVRKTKAAKKKASRGRGRSKGSEDEPRAESADSGEADDSGSAGREADGATSGRKRSRRGGRRSKKAASEGADPDAQADAASPDEAGGEAGSGENKKRRRRGSRGGRRRKKAAASEAVVVEAIPGEEDDLPVPPEKPAKAKAKTKKKTRGKKKAAAAGADEEGSEKGRRKAKKKARSSSKKQEEIVPDQLILVNAIDREEERVAVVENSRIVDFMMNVDSQKTLVNDIYRGRIVNMEPAIGAAFVDFGQGRNGFLHTSDVLSVYGEKDFELSKLWTTPIEVDEWEESSVADEVDDEEESKAPAKGSKKKRSSSRRRSRKREPISDLLSVGDQVVVQITKDAIGDKGPTLTTYISMPGRYLVLMPSMARTGVSRKIPDDRERRRLKRILGSMDLPANMGVIVRTAGVGKTKAELQRDLDYLMGLWETFGKRLKSGRGPMPLYQESEVAIRTMRDLFNAHTEAVVVDDPMVHEQLVDFAQQLMPEQVDRIKVHDGDRPIFHHHGIEQDFEKIFARRVDLPSGGSIVFDQTEALVAIDVNSGRTRSDGFDFEEVALKTNLEAAPEIARQIRLRDLGGILVCDFIDMMKSSSMRTVERALRSAMADDRARSKLGRISQFGLLEMTRQRLGPGMHKKVFQVCPRCRGTGRVRSVPSRAAAILRRLGSAITQKGFATIEVRAHPEVVDYLDDDLQDYLRALEHRSDRKITLTAVPDQPEDSVLRYLRADGREVRPGGRRKR